MRAFHLSVNVQAGGDSLMDTIVEGLQESSRLKSTNEQRRFVGMNNQEEVNIGELEKKMEAIKVARPKAIFPNGIIREGVDELTIRSGMFRTFTNTANLVPLLDKDWHALCPATCKGVEGVAWENLQCVETNKEGSPGGKDALDNEGRQTQRSHVVTNRTRQKLSARRRSAKSCGVRTLGARPLPSRRLCGKWKRGKTRTPRREQKLISCEFPLAS